MSEKLVRPELDDGRTLNRREVIEVLSDGLLYHFWGIEDATRAMNETAATREEADAAKENVVADKEAMKALRKVARKLGIYEEVEEEAKE